MAHSGYCYVVDMWHTLLIVISLTTCAFQHYWLAIANICLLFKFVCSWTIVENVVVKGGFFTNDVRIYFTFVSFVKIKVT